AVASAEVVIDVAADGFFITQSSRLRASQVRIDAAIEDGLRDLYLTQLANGGWPYGGDEREIGAVGGVLTAFQLRGHLLTNNPCSDVYAPTVKAGVDYLLTRIG